MSDQEYTHDNEASARVQSTVLRIASPNRTPIALSGHAFERFIRRDSTIQDLAELFHENSKLRRHRLPEMVRSANLFSTKEMLAAIARTERYIASSYYVTLPRPSAITTALGDCLTMRRSCREYNIKQPLSVQELATVLRYAYGVTGRLCVYSDDTEELWQNLLSVPSGGALYPLELYLVAINIDSITPGLYHYNYKKHRLDYMDQSDNHTVEDFFSCFPVHPEGIALNTVGLLFIVTAVFWRSKAKYGERAYRYVLQESGHLAQNLCLVASALGLGSVPLAAFVDDEVNEILRIDGVDEAAVYTVVMGHPSTPTVREDR